MTLDVIISNGGGDRKAAQVVNGGELLVIDSGSPPFLPQKVKPFRQFLTDDGTTSGSSDMGIDGSVTSQEFWVAADNNDDRYITTLSFEMTMAGSPRLFEFADSGAALTNGVRLFYDAVGGASDIHEGIKSNWDLQRLSLGTPTITSGSPADVFQVRHVTALNDYGLIPDIDITRLVPPFGIKLERGSTQRVVMEIRDDATSATTFNCIAYGFDRFE